MKFLLMRPSQKWRESGTIGDDLQASSTYPPLGLLYVGAVLEKEGHKVEIIDLWMEGISKEYLQKQLLSADAVGINVYTSNYTEAADLSKTIKEIDPIIPLIVGGPHCTFLKQKSLSDIKHADIAVELEGENVIMDLVQFFQESKKLSEIPGIYYRDNGSIKSGKTFEIIKDLDDVPFPARHLVERYDYGEISGGFSVRKKYTSMLTSRGCPFRCRFCSRYGNVVNNYGFRRRSAENVVDEILEIDEKYGSVKFVDDNFLADRKRAHKIFDMLLERDIQIDMLIMGARVDSAERDLYKKMKRAGVVRIDFGIESGCQEILDYYKKRITLQQIRNAVNLAKEMDFLAFGSFIFGAPIETKEHIEKTIKFVCSLPLDVALFRPLQYEMGSDLWVEEVKNKKISKNEYLVDLDINKGLGNFTPTELKNLVDKAYRRFYLRPRHIINQIFESLKRGKITTIKNDLLFMTKFMSRSDSQAN